MQEPDDLGAPRRCRTRRSPPRRRTRSCRSKRSPPSSTGCAHEHAAREPPARRRPPRRTCSRCEAILEPLGHRLVSVTSGTAALKELLLDDFACILLDVQMPEIDGFELATLIKQRERSQHIPIIFLTALSKEEKHVYRGYSAGAVDYIFKPIDPDVLRSKVVGLRRAVGEERADPAAGGAAARAGARRARACERGAVPPARGRDAADRVDGRRRPAPPPTSTGAGSSTPA